MSPAGVGARGQALLDALFRRLGLKPRTGADAVLFTGGSLLYQGARFAAYLLVAKLLGPTLYGLWNGLLLLLTNAIHYGHFGVINAMSREIPLNEGRGAEADNRAVVNVSFTTALVTSSLFAVATLAASFFATDAATVLGLRILALLLVLEQVQVFYEQLLRAERRFRRVSGEQALLSVLLLTVVVGLTWTAGFAGFLWGHVLVFAAIVVFLVRSTAVRPRLAFDRRLALRLARIGLPIMAAGFAYGMLTSLDRLMILAFLGKTELGYYSLAFMAYGTMMLVPRSITQMVYPRMALEYGRTGDPGALRPLIYRPLRYLVVIMIPLLAVVFFLGPWFIGVFLPQYAPGIPAFKVTLVGVFFLSFMGSFGNFLNVTDHQKLYLGIQVAALGLALLLNWLVLEAGWGIVGVATATLITQVVYVAALWAACQRILAGAAQRHVHCFSPES